MVPLAGLKSFTSSKPVLNGSKTTFKLKNE
jgi:hypothetical protein